ncbi:MAG: DUF1254 domain-containing protein, partial [Nevskia sp.]|nr:DUF1254 domain-containing protein [Nevskia sp.]
MTGKPLESAAPPRQRRSTSAAALLLVLVVAVLLVAQARSAWTIGVAYRYALPLYEVMRLRYATVYDEHNPHRTRLNSFAHKRSLPEPGDHLVTTPNADTLYSLAVLDLSGGPVRLEVPDTAGRYYSAALLDAYTNNFSIISRRTTGARGHSFIIVGPGWERAEPPDGAQLIHSPTATALLLLRILVDGPQDLPAVRQLQDGFRLGASPLKEAGTPPRPVAGDAGSFVAVVNQALADSPPPAADAAMLKRIAKAGIAPGAGEPDPALSAQWSTYLPLQQKLLAWLVGG